jgi:RNA polymerase sigma-70 factor (ECF subfamily)
LSPQKLAASAAAAETQLIARAQQGDEEAFSALFEAHKRRVYSLCLRMLGNPTDAEDLTQEAFLQLFRKIATFRGESAFSTWLHRLSVNVVLMHFRKKGLNQISLDETENSQGEPVKREYGDDDRRLVGSIDRIGLNRAIAELPPGYRTVFVLHDVEGYEHNEIAEIMNCSIGNSKSQLHKARLKLREWFQHHQSQEGRRSPAHAAREVREEQ